jgi:hypothetical protein
VALGVEDAGALGAPLGRLRCEHCGRPGVDRRRENRADVLDEQLEPSTGRAADAQWTVESASALASMTTASPRLSWAWSTAPSSPGWRVTSSKPIASSQSIAAGASR